MLEPIMQIPIELIDVDPARRQRKELDQQHIFALADSLSRIGLLHPLVVEQIGDRYRLISGEHRFEAARLNKWTTVACQLREDVSEQDRVAIALEENIKRRDISWQEKVETISHYHNLHKAQDATWTLDKTGEALGLDRSSIGRMMRVAAMLDDPDVQASATLVTAMNFVDRKLQRAQANETEELLSSISFDGEQKEPAASPPPPEPSFVPITNADIYDWIECYNGPSFNVLHCDFPYGINFDRSPGMRKSVRARYDDSETTLRELMELMPRFPIAKVAHLIFWFSPQHYENVKLELVRQGWKVDPYPLIWHKSDNSGIIRDAKRTGRNTYEMAFFASRGDRYIVRSVSTSYPAAQPRTGHPSEKNVDMLTHFLRMVVDNTSTVLDPTCGSGTALIAAKRLGAKTILGVEKDPEFYKLARDRWLTSRTE